MREEEEDSNDSEIEDSNDAEEEDNTDAEVENSNVEEEEEGNSQVEDRKKAVVVGHIHMIHKVEVEDNEDFDDKLDNDYR